YLLRSGQPQHGSVFHLIHQATRLIHLLICLVHYIRHIINFILGRLFVLPQESFLRHIL
ncbi:hypothetical protein BGX38DRAFT_1209886, partial [Terfezia claveryi]